MHLRWRQHGRAFAGREVPQQFITATQSALSIGAHSRCKVRRSLLFRIARSHVVDHSLLNLNSISTQDKTTPSSQRLLALPYWPLQILQTYHWQLHQSSPRSIAWPLGRHPMSRSCPSLVAQSAVGCPVSAASCMPQPHCIIVAAAAAARTSGTSSISGAGWTSQQHHGQTKGSNAANQQTSRTVPAALAYDQRIAHEDSVIGVGDSFWVEFVIEFVIEFVNVCVMQAFHHLNITI